jgi:hypothetical protein
MQTLTQSQRESYHDIICSGQAALRRWSPTNPMRRVIERQIADARRVLGIA